MFKRLSQYLYKLKMPNEHKKHVVIVEEMMER